MSVDDLHQQFAAGRITRSAFIRRLLGFGMSSAVALHYTDLLALEVAHAKPNGVPNKPPQEGFCEDHPDFCDRFCTKFPESPFCADYAGE